MAIASLDTRQAKALDNNTVSHEGRLFYAVGKPYYDQCYRNNHQAPKTLKGNRRLADTPGRWGVVASKHGANVAFAICFALDYVGAIPKDVGKILCLSSDHVFEGHGEPEELTEAGVTLLFDDIDGGVFPGFDGKAVVDVSMIEYRPGYRTTANYDLVWKGETPAEYIDYAERTAFNEAYSYEINQIDACLKQLGARFWGMDSKVEFVKKLSYGYFDGGGLDKLSRECSTYSSYTRFPCRFEYESDVEGARKTCHEILAPMNATLRIWAEILRENCLMLDLREFDPSDEQKISKFLETGKIFGVASAMRAYYEAGVPVDDILA